MGALLCAAVTLSGSLVASGHGVSPAHAATTVTVNVGYFPNITHAQALLGFGQGTFAKELPGVTMVGQVFNAGPDEMNALYAGAIDIGYIGPGPAINGFVKSHGLVKIVAFAATAGAELIARAGSKIHSLKDLAGKTVAIPQVGNTQDIELRALLRDNGLSPSDQGGTVKIIAVQNADTLTLFKKGLLDAALVPEPWGSRLLKETGARVVLDANQIYGGATPATVIIARTAFLVTHRDLIVKFLRVDVQLTQQLQNRAAVIGPLNAQLKKLTGKSLKTAELALALKKTVFVTDVDQTQLTRFAGFSAAAGYLKSSASLSGLVDPWPLSHLQDQNIR